MSDCRFGVSPVNYPDPDPDSPKRLSPKSPGAKTLPEPSLHDCETSSTSSLPEASL